MLNFQEQLEEHNKKHEEEFHAFLEECKQHKFEIDEVVQERIKQAVKEYFNRMSTLKE